MKRFFLFLIALFLAAAWIATSANQPTPKKDPQPVLRDPFRPDHPTREEWKKEKDSAASAAGDIKKER